MADFASPSRRALYYGGMTRDSKIVGLWSSESTSPESLLDAVPLDEPAHGDAVHDSVIDAAWADPVSASTDESAQTDRHASASARRDYWNIALSIVALAWLLAYASQASDGFRMVPAPARWPDMVAIACVPLVLLALVYLIVSRGSARRIERHHDMVTRLDRQVDATVEKIAAIAPLLGRAGMTMREQGNALTAHGLDAARALERSASEIATTVATIAAGQARLETATDRALTRAQTLVETLPRIEDVATRTAGLLRDAGASAHRDGAALEAVIAALTDHSDRAEARIGARVASLAEQGAAIEGQAGNAAEAMIRLMEEHARSLGEIERRIRNCGEATLAGAVRHVDAAAQRLQSARFAFDDSASEALAGLDRRIAATNDAVRTVSEAAAAGHVRIETLGRALEALRNREQDALETLSTTRNSTLEAAARRLSDLTEAARLSDERLASAAASADDLRARAEAALEALEAALRESEESLPPALANVDAAIAAQRTGIAALTPEVARYTDHARAAATAIDDSAARIAAASAGLAAERTTMDSALSHAGRQSADLHRLVGELGEQIRAVADADVPRATGAIETVRAAAIQASERARAALEEIVVPYTVQLSGQLDNVLEAALSRHFDQRLTVLRNETDRTVAAAAATVDDAVDRLARIERPASPPLPPVAPSEGSDGTTTASTDPAALARRVALLTQSLQAAGVNVAEMLGSDISDEAWSAYLAGDRTLFTRRAARLVDRTDARAILARYEGDMTFRGNVNRYVADFETILRELLASREGQTLSVIVLSSDMGKLYVALAMAIERLRP